MKKEFKIILVSLGFFLLTLLAIHVVGNTLYDTVQYPTGMEVEHITYTYSKEGIVTVSKIQKGNESATLSIRGEKKGETSLLISFFDKEGNQETYDEKYYVHPFGLVTKNTYFGTFHGTYFIPLFMISIFITLIYFNIQSLRKKKTIYSYSVVTDLSIILFSLVYLVGEFLTLRQTFEYPELYIIYDDIINSFSRFSFLIFPFMFLLSIFLVVNNIKLIRKEGYRFSNLLGILLGCFLILGTFSTNFIYRILDQLIDVHGPLGHHIEIFINSIIYVTLGYFECLMVSNILIGIYIHTKKPEIPKDFVLILGCGIRKDGTLMPLLKGRADKALEFAKEQEEKTGKKITFIPSGGQGPDEIISEAKAISNYLMEQGIPKKQILLEDQSTTTKENFLFSKRIMDKKKKHYSAIFSTSDYHVFRSGVIANKVGLNADGIGSKTKYYFYTNALIREFIANLYNEKRRHIRIILSIIIGIAGLLIFSYYAKIL